MISRKRSWWRDEVILALELYLHDGVAGLGACRSLSQELRGLPIEQHLTRDPSFRNWQAVRNKLYNLQWLDTDGAQGRENVGEATREVWRKFGRDAERVGAAAQEVRRSVADAAEHADIEVIEYEADESAIRLVAHRRRERDPSLARRKRVQVEQRTRGAGLRSMRFRLRRRVGGPRHC